MYLVGISIWALFQPSSRWNGGAQNCKSGDIKIRDTAHKGTNIWNQVYFIYWANLPSSLANWQSSRATFVARRDAWRERRALDLSRHDTTRRRSRPIRITLIREQISKRDSICETWFLGIVILVICLNRSYWWPRCTVVSKSLRKERVVYAALKRHPAVV